MACFPKKYIALLNTVQTTEEDNVELFTDSITVSQASGNQLSGADLWTDKSVYGNRSKVALTLPNLPADVKELTLSVVRKDYVLKGFPISADGQKNYTSVPERSFAAECEGHIVTGRLMGAPADNVNARLACVGKDIRVFGGQPKADAIYVFLYDRNNGYAGDCINCITGAGKSLPIGAYFSFCRGVGGKTS